jgi:hypothetical protein
MKQENQDDDDGNRHAEQPEKNCGHCKNLLKRIDFLTSRISGTQQDYSRLRERHEGNVMVPLWLRRGV